jgi:hypothetical protein
MASDQRKRGHLVKKKRLPCRSTPRDDSRIYALILDLHNPKNLKFKQKRSRESPDTGARNHYTYPNTQSCIPNGELDPT